MGSLITAFVTANLLAAQPVAVEPIYVDSGPVARANGDYEEENIGSWVLRTDRRARTFGVVWVESGVIELSARTSDGQASWVIRDNGARLLAALRATNCALTWHISSYDDWFETTDSMEELTGQVLTGCPLASHEVEVRSWLRDFPLAFEGMKARAQALYGPQLTRCVEPPFQPGVPPSLHPICGFPPPEIGENHPQ